MRFAPMKDLLVMANEKKIGYGAFVVVSYDTARAAIEAGNEMNVPIIFIMGTDCTALLGGFDNTVSIVKAACYDAKIPVCLHLDHARTYEDCCAAINAGFSSVMIDGSALPIEENIALTRKVVEFAHPLGVTVEGELGRLVGEEGNIIVCSEEDAQTDPEEARYFVEKSGVDCLAVAIGTQHGIYKKAPKLNIARLKKIRELVNIPLVLHGGSGTPDDQVKEAIENGIAKINVATEIMVTHVNSVEQQKAENPNFNYKPEMYEKAKDAVKAVIIKKMKAFSFR